MKQKGVITRNLAIMFTDIKGFTARVSDETRDGLSELIAIHDKLLSPVFAHYGGKIVKTIGDAFLVRFNSPTDAVLCGISIQEVLRQHNAFASDKEKLEVRIAINVGDVEIKDKDIMGDAVNIAARLEGVTEPGEVYFTEAVFLAMNRKEVPSAIVGERTFKGIPFPIRIYKVMNDPASDQTKRIISTIRLTKKGPVLLSQPKRERNSVLPWCVAAGAIFTIFAVIYYYQFSHPKLLLRQANRLTYSAEYLKALDIFDELLTKTPQNEDAQKGAVTAATGYWNRLIDESEQEKAVQWLKAEVDQKRYLRPMIPQLEQLDAQLKIKSFMDGHTHSGDLHNEVYKLLQKYPKNPGVPYIIAETLSKRYVNYSYLYLYQEALERGGYKDDPKILATCQEILQNQSMSPHYLNQARLILEKYFPGQKSIQ